MPSRSRHSRNHNSHSNRSSNKNRNRRDTHSQNSNHCSKSESKSNATANAKKHSSTDKSCKDEEKSCLLYQEESKCNTSGDIINEFEEEILYELSNDSSSVYELSALLEQYVHRRNASALFLSRIICDWVSPEYNTAPNKLNNNLLLHSETCDRIRNSFLKVLFSLTDVVTFKKVINQIAWSLSIIKILSSGLPTLCSSLMHWLAQHVESSHLSSNNLQRDELRFIVMFLRPEIVEQCAELVQFNASIFEGVFRELIDALSDRYQPFRIWLFARLCSKRRKLIEAQLAKFICFGDDNVSRKKTQKKKKKTQPKQTNDTKRRCKSWIVNMDEEEEEEEEDDEVVSININRLMRAFKFCLDASNELVIANESRTYYELGHLICHEVISMASTLRYHYDLFADELDSMLAIMHCNLASIYLYCAKYKLALYAANVALKYDINCVQSHRIRAEYYIKYAGDSNCALNDLYEILCVDSDHPYAIASKKDIDDAVHDCGYVCREIECVTKRMPCRRWKHSAVSYRTDRLIVFGGQDMSDCLTILNDLWVFDLSTNAWTPLDTAGAIPSRRHSHVAHIIGDKLYIIGGAKHVICDDELIEEGGVKQTHKNGEKSTSNDGYALGGWFTNFFNKTDAETMNKISELATSGIIEEEEAYYDATYFAAVEMMDLKHNKWIKPETTGTSPKHMMIDAHSVCVGKKIFVFPMNDRYGAQFFVLETDTLHWESFEIPKTHAAFVLHETNVIPTVTQSNKILFVTPFGSNSSSGKLRYIKHCLLFTKNMEWSPIRQIPYAQNGQLTAYNRAPNTFSLTSHANYLVIHGTVSCTAYDVPPPCDSECCSVLYHMNEDSKQSEEGEYDSSSSVSEDEADDLMLSPLYEMSRVSIVESLLLDKNPKEMHRIGNEKYNCNTLLTHHNKAHKVVKKRRIQIDVSKMTQKRSQKVITRQEGKTRTTITTITTANSADAEEEEERVECCCLEIFDFVSMRWLPRIHLLNNSAVLNAPRMHHSVSVVGNADLCIFGGASSTSNVLMLPNFVQNTHRMNDKYYKSNKTNWYDETNALSLSKYLFGLSPAAANSYATATNQMVQCANCLILECNRFNFRTCSGCAKVQYCSKLCQKNHWKCNHRHFCSKNHIRYQPQ
eukprot:207728_1